MGAGLGIDMVTDGAMDRDLALVWVWAMAVSLEMVTATVQPVTTVRAVALA